VLPDNVETPNNGKEFTVDALSLLIVGELLRQPESTFKGIAAVAGVDQRTVARRVALMKELGVIRQSFEVDWDKLGVGTSAFVGCNTSVGEKALGMLREYIKRDPRIVESFETVGSHEYVLKVLGNDLSDLRNSVLRDLEPLTADLTASVVSSEVKHKDYFQFVRYLRETRYPNTRSSSWGDAAPPG
jgi:DNA-binding Lrp family transcriptional regulator